ncbi:MAG TPA: ETC complex I subunit [Afifellaceae bacterium]|nr:ETC complex I subunit [Afifellaceae bacterium]
MMARIYRPAKTAMSSGRAKTRRWMLEFEPQERKAIDPLMGYTASGDMRQQVRLRFSSKEAAIAYAEKNGIPYRLYEPNERRPRPVSYAENFRSDRLTPWTH